MGYRWSHPPTRGPSGRRWPGKIERQMRKRYKRKSHSLCAMCKAYKVHGERRWTGRDLDGLERFERERLEWTGNVLRKEFPCPFVAG